MDLDYLNIEIRQGAGYIFRHFKKKVDSGRHIGAYKDRNIVRYFLRFGQLTFRQSSCSGNKRFSCG